MDERRCQEQQKKMNALAHKTSGTSKKSTVKPPKVVPVDECDEDEDDDDGYDNKYGEDEDNSEDEEGESDSNRSEGDMHEGEGGNRDEDDFGVEPDTFVDDVVRYS